MKINEPIREEEIVSDQYCLQTFHRNSSCLLALDAVQMQPRAIITILSEHYHLQGNSMNEKQKMSLVF